MSTWTPRQLCLEIDRSADLGDYDVSFVHATMRDGTESPVVACYGDSDLDATATPEADGIRFTIQDSRGFAGCKTLSSWTVPVVWNRILSDDVALWERTFAANLDRIAQELP